MEKSNRTDKTKSVWGKYTEQKLVDTISKKGMKAFTETFLDVRRKTNFIDPEDFFCEDDALDEKYRAAHREFQEKFFRDNLSLMSPESIAETIVREFRPDVISCILNYDDL